MSPQNNHPMTGEPADLRDRMRLAVEDAFLPYLEQVLAQNPPERHPHIKTQFAEHMDFLADFCLRGYPGPGGLTVEFIKGLHRAMFPPGYRQEITTRDGQKILMIPGEYKTVSNNCCDNPVAPGGVVFFMVPEKVPSAMGELIVRFNNELSQNPPPQQGLAAILWFVFDFLEIHPFVDANSRVACILADMLAIRYGLPPFHFHSIKHKSQAELYAVLNEIRAVRNLTPMLALLAKYGWPESNQLQIMANE